MDNQRADIRELVAAALGGPAHPLATWYAGLLDGSPAIRAFAAANTTKIRKKARYAADADTRRDLRCELAVAAALADRRSPLVYEPLAAEGRRGPDFLLRHKGHSDVYVEVSRLRPARAHVPFGEASGVNEADALRSPDPTGRLAALLSGKLGQLVAGAANLLVLVSDDGPFSAAEVAATVQGLRRRAETKDDAYFAYRGLAGARAALQLLPRLSGVLVVAPSAVLDTLAPHVQARHPLPADLARAATYWGLAATIGPLADGDAAG